MKAKSTLKTYEVCIGFNGRHIVEVTAKNEDEAGEMALNGNYADYKDDSEDFEVDWVEEIK
jgi:hypothetical protein